MSRTMMFFLVSIAPYFFSQGKDELFYYTNNDSLLGVKDSNGHIIIPAQFRDAQMGRIENGTLIEEPLIFFLSHHKESCPEPHAVGFMYDRKGNFLFHPFWFDNGTDDFSEGLMRFVKNGKIGFADKRGTIVIPAQYDFADSFRYGYTEVCQDCYWHKTDDEHSIVTGGQWWVIDKKGQTVKPSDKKSHESDIEINGKFYPNPFIYNQNEEEILDFFRRQEKELSALYYGQFSNQKKNNYRKLYFEIVDKVEGQQGFYEIYTYDDEYYRINDFTFLVDNQEKLIYHVDFYGKKTKFSHWKKFEAQIINQKIN